MAAWYYYHFQFFLNKENLKGKKKQTGQLPKRRVHLSTSYLCCFFLLPYAVVGLVQYHKRRQYTAGRPASLSVIDSFHFAKDPLLGD